MAVTEILGTDSLSSSRVTLNNNFLDLQDEIQDLQALLNPSTNTLSVNDITTGSITINAALSNGVATLLETTATSLTVDGETDLKQLIKKTGVSGTYASGIQTIPTTLAHSTYFVDCSATLDLSNVNVTGGEEITLVCATSGAGSIATAQFQGASAIVMNNPGSTLTIRFIDSKWYIIGSHDCAITP